LRQGDVITEVEGEAASADDVRRGRVEQATFARLDAIRAALAAPSDDSRRDRIEHGVFQQLAAVRGLERAGLVRTVKAAHDRRKSYVHLTARGRRLAATMSPLIRHSNDLALAVLSPDEVAAFKRFVVRIQRALDAESRNRNSWSAWRTEKLAQEVGL